jgi:hypothetical protein
LEYWIQIAIGRNSGIMKYWNMRILKGKNIRVLKPVCTRYIFMFTTWVLLYSFSFPQEISLKAKLDSTHILIGDQVNLSLEVTQPYGLDLNFPEFLDTITAKIEILEKTNDDTIFLENDQVFLKQNLLITCFDSGFYEIPPFEFSYELDTVAVRLKSNPLYLEVLRTDISLRDTTQAIFDIKLPYGAPIGFREIAPYILGGLFIILFIGAIYYYLKKRKQEEPILKIKKPLEPPHITALRELDKLKMEKLWQKNKIKLYYTRLTEIIRIYLEGRFEIMAMEQTTTEILQSLLNTGFKNNRIFNILSDMLYRADLVKFAKARPLPDENETSMLNAYILVNETKEAVKITDQVSELTDT